LREALESNPDYIVGLQPLTLASDRWPQIQSDFPNIKWVDADCIHNASIDHRLEKLFHMLRRRDVMVVGPSHIVSVAKALGVHWFMLPYMNCWERFGAVRNWIINESVKFDNPVVLLCASMMSEVLIDEFKNCDNMTMIDMGSVLDPFVGVKSRRYHHKLKI